MVHGPTVEKSFTISIYPTVAALLLKAELTAELRSLA